MRASRVLRAATLLATATAISACKELDPPPDERIVPRTFSAPVLTLGLRSAGPPPSSPAPSASAELGCCDALRAEVARVGVEDESALLFAALECDRATKAKAFSPSKIKALIGDLELPESCRR
ncbi:MAG: hypothetical protein U0414_25840 [Polyangiaceae bacterium]